VHVVVMVVGVVGAKAGMQEAGPHSGPTAADRGYTAGELAGDHAPLGISNQRQALAYTERWGANLKHK